MSVLTSEAVILRTWPVHEADLLVSFFTRDYGRLKGMAKAALKSRKRFGGALEPMTLTRAWFAERPRQELVRLDQLEIIRSPLSSPIDPARLTVLSFFSLGMTRLMGLLPDIAHCTVCSEPLRAGEVSFNPHADGLFCALHRNG